MSFYGENFDGIYRDLISEVTENPQFICKPRGQLIKENLAQTLHLSDPRARLLNNSQRETNYGFGVGEFLWYWSGKQDLATMMYYNKRMKDFSNDGETLNSAYGHRLRSLVFFTSPTGYGTGGTQWETCKQTLLQDSDSRRAVMLINLPEDERQAVVAGSKDVPCTLSLQFFIRDNALHLHTLMRSNDIIWGLTYDLFSFTLFQECMLLDLRKTEQFKDLELGDYYHTAGSIHIYERHFEQAERIVREYNSGDFKHASPMERITSLEELSRLCKDEELLRTKAIESIDLSSYSGGLRWMADQLNKHREKRDAEPAKAA